MREQPVRITDEALAILKGKHSSRTNQTKPPVNQTAALQAEPQESSPALPDFPDIAWRGLFADYRDAMQGTTEASDVAHFATLWAAIAVALGRKVSLYSGDTIYPNVFLAFFGATGDKKTTAQRRLCSCHLLQHYPSIKIIHNVGTTEGLADAVTDAELGIYLFLWEEFSNLLARARWSGSTLLEFITETFDCPNEWGTKYRKNSIDLKEPTPTILTATTAEWFWKYAKTEDFFGGFGNRFLFLSGPRKPPIPNPAIPDPEKLRRVTDALKALSNCPIVKAQWDAGAKKTWDAFYVEFESRERSGLLAAAVKRAHVYVRKLAMTYAAIEGTLPYIDREQLQAAVALVLYAVDCTQALMDMQATQNKPLAELEERFLRYIGLHENERVRRLQQKMARYCGDAETFNRVLKSLVQADRIEIQDRRVRLSV